MKLPNRILDLFERSYYLVDLDYRSKFENFKAIEKAIDNQDMQYIYQEIDEMFWEDFIYAQDYAMEELVKEITRNFNVGKERAWKFVDTYEDLIREVIGERDCSNPTEQMLRNLGDIVVYYDVEDELVSPLYMKDDEWKEAIRTIKKSLGIKMRDKTWDRELNELLANASYGGRLVIYFTWDVENLCKLKDMNQVEFKNPHIALIDTYNGSGHDVWLKGLKCTLPFNVLQLYVEKTQRYNYTYEVCGMSDDWCNDTVFHFSKNNRRK